MILWPRFLTEENPYLFEQWRNSVNDLERVIFEECQVADGYSTDRPRITVHTGKK